MTEARDSVRTGNFEVKITNSGEHGELIHSKTKYGHGKCESKDQLDALFAKIDEFLSK